MNSGARADESPVAEAETEAATETGAEMANTNGWSAMKIGEAPTVGITSVAAAASVPASSTLT